jgi:hypothetical protein
MTETNRPALGVELMGEELPLVLFPQRLRELCEIVKVHQLSFFSFGAARVIPDGLSFCAKANPGRAPVLSRGLREGGEIPADGRGAEKRVSAVRAVYASAAGYESMHCVPRSHPSAHPQLRVFG